MVICEDGTLNGGELLSVFTLAVKEIFSVHYKEQHG